MTGTSLRLYLNVPPGSQLNSGAGQIGFQRLYVDQTQGAGCISISIEYTADAELAKNGPSRWVWLESEVWNQRVPPRRFGSIEIDLNARRQFDNTYPAALTWRWRLYPEEIESLENSRDPTAQEVNFEMRAAGVAQVANAVYTVYGNGYLTIPASEWLGLLKQLGYGVPPSASSLATVASTLHPTWKKAESELADARKRLAQGEDYEAMTSCLDRFSAIVSKPYAKIAWLDVLPDDPGQKRESLAETLAAHCTYLNRVGYHRDRGRPPGDEVLERMPLDHGRPNSR